MGGFLILGAVVWLVVVVITVQVAVQKGRRAWAWAILGVLFGPFAMFAVVLMGPAKGGGSGGGTGRRDDSSAAFFEEPNEK
jgi:hypothetical protein